MDGRGPVDRHRLAAAVRHPRGAPGRRLAAAVLHAALGLDGRLRRRPGRDPGAVGGDRPARDPRRTVGGLEPLRPPRGPDLRRAVRGQPLPHQLRAGDPHVLAHAGALAAGHRRLPARVRLRPPALPAGVHGPVRGHAVHPQLGALPRGGPGLRAGALLVGVGGALELLEGRRARLWRRCPSVPALGADAAAPDPVHRRSLAQLARLRRARSDLQVAAGGRHAHGGAAAGRRLGHRRAAPAAGRGQGAHRPDRGGA